jgi:hypothetical protein
MVDETAATDVTDPGVLIRKFGAATADAGSWLPVHGIRKHAGGT